MMMQSPTLLTTKFYFPPARQELVARPRLVRRLQEGLMTPLTLISAPAGYGKTTLMSEWRESAGQSAQAAWLSLDKDDNDPARFLTYFAAALGVIRPGFGETAISQLQSTQPAIQTILAGLINEIAALATSFILVLDDYHLISAQPANDILAYILDHQPSHMHMVILTRADPPIPLARLRARGQLIEIRAADLRFTSVEIAAFMDRVMRLALSSQEIEALERRTEGWIAGVQLAGLSLRGHANPFDIIESFSGADHYVLDFLIEEVLNRQSGPLRDFLLKTSILDRLTGSLCDALTGQEDGNDTLAELERLNMFLSPLDIERRWYRYHPLFADVLRSKLLHSLPDRHLELHNRAAIWLEANGYPDQAIDHALVARDFERAVGFIESAWAKFLSGKTRMGGGRGVISFQSWLESFPVDFTRQHPTLNMIKARMFWQLGQLEKIGPCFQAVETQLARWEADGQTPPENIDIPIYRAEILAIRSIILSLRGSHEMALDLACHALELEPVKNHPVRAWIYLSLYTAYREKGYFNEAGEACRTALSGELEGAPPGIVMDLYNGSAFIDQFQGKLWQAEQTYSRAQRYANENRCLWLPHFANTYIEFGRVHYMRNRLDDAQACLEKGLALCDQGGHHLVGLYGRLFLSSLQRARGEAQAALETVREVVQLARETGVTSITDQCEAHLARMEAESGDPTRALAWVSSQDLQVGDRIGSTYGICALQAARVMLNLEKEDEALELLRRIEMAAQTSGAVAWQIEALVLQASALHKKGETHKALDAIRNALLLAGPEGVARVFLDEGEPVLDLLRQVKSKEIEAQYANRLLSENSIVAPAAARPAQPLVEPLSKRELEILELIAVGHSNKEIASQLFITVATVKRHAFTIFQKLDVANRTQAVAKARELKLI